MTAPGVDLQIPQRPRELPKICRQVAEFALDPNSSFRAPFRDRPETDAAMERVGRHLQVADLFWVTPEMSALALTAGSGLPEADWSRDARPASVGLLVFADGVTTIEGLPVDAMSWGPSPAGLLVWCWTHRRRMERAVSSIGAEFVKWMPPLLPMWGEEVPIRGAVAAADLPEGLKTPLTTLAAAWLLMQQPTLSSGSVERPPARQRRAARARGKELPDVTIIDLRRHYIPDHEPVPAGEDRKYRYRWVVSGHWRDQAHGPGRALRRRIWIPSYVKGPDGAPLLATERVNVWRR